MGVLLRPGGGVAEAKWVVGKGQGGFKRVLKPRWDVGKGQGMILARGKWDLEARWVLWS